MFGISVNFKGRKKHLREEKVKMATVNDDAMIFYQDMFIYSGKWQESQVFPQVRTERQQ